MIYYIIAFGLYGVVFIISTYFTNIKFRKFTKHVFAMMNDKFITIKNALISGKGLIVQQINE